MPKATAQAASVRLSQLLAPLDLDPLTVPDDAAFPGRLRRQRNLPEYVKSGLPALF
jgi:hypothetical protein